jgi:hypothetical protein
VFALAYEFFAQQVSIYGREFVSKTAGIRGEDSRHQKDFEHGEISTGTTGMLAVHANIFRVLILVISSPRKERAPNPRMILKMILKMKMKTLLPNL